MSKIVLPWGDKIQLTEDELMAVFDCVYETDIGTDRDDAWKKLKPYYDAMSAEYEKRHGVGRGTKG